MDAPRFSRPTPCIQPESGSSRLTASRTASAMVSEAEMIQATCANLCHCRTKLLEHDAHSTIKRPWPLTSNCIFLSTNPLVTLALHQQPRLSQYRSPRRGARLDQRAISSSCPPPTPSSELVQQGTLIAYLNGLGTLGPYLGSIFVDRRWQSAHMPTQIHHRPLAHSFIPRCSCRSRP